MLCFEQDAEASLRDSSWGAGVTSPSLGSGECWVAPGHWDCLRSPLQDPLGCIWEWGCCVPPCLPASAQVPMRVYLTRRV